MTSSVISSSLEVTVGEVGECRLPRPDTMDSADTELTELRLYSFYSQDELQPGRPRPLKVEI